MIFKNDAKAFYNWWEHEYFCAEYKNGTLILNQRKLEVLPYNPKKVLLLVSKIREQHSPPETKKAQYMALIFSAIQSALTREVIHVQKLLEETYKKVLQEF